MAALRKAIKETKCQRVKTREPEPSVAQKVDAWFKEDAAIAHGWNANLEPDNAAYNSVPRPACLYYERRSLDGSKYQQPILVRDQIEELRKAEAASFSYNDFDSYQKPELRRTPAQNVAFARQVVEWWENHLHGVACRYRERLAALAEYDAKLKAAREANGCAAATRELNKRDRALWADLRSILATPARTPADLFAKLKIARHQSPQWFKKCTDVEYRAMRSLYADLERMAEGESHETGPTNSNVIPLVR